MEQCKSSSVQTFMVVLLLIVVAVQDSVGVIIRGFAAEVSG